MKRNNKPKKESRMEKVREAVNRAREIVAGCAFGTMLYYVDIICDQSYPMAKDDWAYVSGNGIIRLNPARDADSGEWAYIIAHCLLHLGLGHFQPNRENDPLWNAACDMVVTRFLRESKIGREPGGFDEPLPLSARDEEATLEALKDKPNLSPSGMFSTMSNGRHDMVELAKKPERFAFPDVFAEALQESIQDSIKFAADQPSAPGGKHSRWEKTREWFISSYPLLGALAADFRLVEDRDTVRRLGVPVAAVSPQLKEIYVNSYAELSSEERQFVMAHELLHVALRHDARIEGRDPVLWNVACDYVINGWLVDMKLGSLPDGVLYDQQFQGMAAEAVYDLIFEYPRQYWKLDPKDLIYGDDSWWNSLEGAELDEFYRSAIRRGLDFHQNTGRGLLPADFVEEIYAVSHPPICWDVKLARWFDEHFEPAEPRRTYARLSRRQSSTPDIPRPAWYKEEKPEARNIYGVVLDTSGSMERSLLAAALGAIASYSEARDVNHVRVVFCDAAAYDQGVMSPRDLGEAVQVRGRGGTVLQPGIDLLDNDADFPKEAPVLIITDGGCDRLNLRGREHAYLVPKGNRLPFPPRGPVFYLD